MKTKNYILSKISALVFLFLGTFAFAQAPDAMSYQAVVRNTAGTLISNQAIGVKMSVLKTSASGTVVYEETFTPKPVTNSNGLVTLEIGKGTPSTGTFSGIDWSAGPYFVKSEIDPAGGTVYSVVSTSQLLSVPYALYAKNAGSGAGFTLPYEGTSSTNNVDKFKIINTDIQYSNAGYFVNSSATNDAPAIMGLNNSIDKYGVGVQGMANSNNASKMSAGVRGMLEGSGLFGTGVLGIANNARGVSGYTDSGVGGFFSASATGIALNTYGKLQFENNGEGAGKVLTSDAEGNATWETAPSETAMPKIHFSSTKGSSQAIPTEISTDINSWTGIDEAGGSNYNAETGEYTIPITGYYSVKSQINFKHTPMDSGKNAQLSIYIDNNMIKLAIGNASSVSNFDGDIPIFIEQTLTAGQKVKIVVWQNFSGTNFLEPFQSSFSIHLIH